MIIDGHAHACGLNYDAGSILETLDRHHADKVILCPGEKESKKTYSLPVFTKDHMYFINKLTSFVVAVSGASKRVEGLNQSVYELCQRNPDRLLQAYWANPNNHQAVFNLERDLDRFRFKLLKLHQGWSYFECNAGPFEPVAGWALKNGMPIFIHLKARKDVRDMIEFIKRKPDNVFIIAHLIGLEEFMQTRIPITNVYFDISPPQLIPYQKLKAALEHFGSERLVLGTDTPYGKDNLRINIERINQMNMSQNEKDNILGDNLQRLLGL